MDTADNLYIAFDLTIRSFVESQTKGKLMHYLALSLCESLRFLDIRLDLIYSYVTLKQNFGEIKH